MKRSKFITEASHLTYRTSANETIGTETGDYYPVFYNVFAQSAQSAEMLLKALQHTVEKRRFVVYKHDRSAVLSFTTYG